MFFFRICNRLPFITHQNPELDQFLLFSYTKVKMQILFHQYHFFYLLNDTKIILFGSKLTKKSELTY